MNISRINWQDTLPVRHKVLWPDKSKEFCIVDGDQSAKHYGIYLEDQIIGVASIYNDGNSARLRKFAVDEKYQGHGYGSQLLKRVIELQRQVACEIFWCDARESAVGFYQQFGMQVEGDIFHKSGVAYFKMSLNLQA